MSHFFPCASDETPLGGEYIITVGLIAIAAIGVVSLFGDNIRALFATSANALAWFHDGLLFWLVGYISLAWWWMIPATERRQFRRYVQEWKKGFED